MKSQNLLSSNLCSWNWEGKIINILIDTSPSSDPILSTSSSIVPSISGKEQGSSASSPRIIIELLDDFPTEYSEILLTGPRSHRPLLCIEMDHANNDLRQYNGLWSVQQIEKNRIYCSSPHFSKEICNSLWNHQYYLHKPLSTICTETNIQFLKYPLQSSASPNPSSKGKIYLAPTLVFHCLISIFNIVAIDTVAQTFQIDLYTELRLKYLTNHEDVDAIMKLLECYRATIPTIDFLNVSEPISEREIWTAIEPNLQGELNDFVIKIRFKAIFIEKMELEDFPFDLQDLNIPLTFNTSVNRVTLRPNLKYPSVFQVNSFQLSSIFEVVYNDLVMSSVHASNPSESSAGIIYPRCKFTVYLWRKTGYYISNVILPICVLTLLSPLSCSLNDDGTSLGTADRLGITLTLLLTAVAYKFVVASSLPTVSYLTLLDSYVLLCFAFLCLNAIENVIFPLFVYYYDVKKSAEWNFVIAYYGCFVLINLIYLFSILHCNRQRSKIRNISLLAERIRRLTAQRSPKSLKSHEVEKIVEKILLDHGYTNSDINHVNLQLQRPKTNLMKYFRMWRHRKVRTMNEDGLLLGEAMSIYTEAIDSEIKTLVGKHLE